MLRQHLHLRAAAVALGTLVPIAATHAQGPPTFEVTDLGSLSGLFTSTHAFAINDSGVVVGDALDDDLAFRAFAWRDGVMIDLGGERGTYSRAFAVSDNGLVAGWDEDAQGSHRAAVWANGRRHHLPMPPGFIGAEAFAVNRAGMVGGSGIHQNRFRFPMAWINGQPVQLSNGEGMVSSISDDGVAVGRVTIDGFYSAVTWQRGIGHTIDMQVLPDLGANHEVAQDRNVHGVIVGAAFSPDTSKTHAVRWEAGAIIDLGLFQGFFPTDARAINDAGVIVGNYFDPGADANRGLMWLPDRSPHDLNTLIPDESPWILETVTQVNDAGQIVGWGLRGDRSGVRGFMLTPNP